MTMGKVARSDDSFARLHAAGWTVGDVAVHGHSGVVWLVTGSNGENRIEARGICGGSGRDAAKPKK
jgi:hypothetical protein